MPPPASRVKVEGKVVLFKSAPVLLAVVVGRSGGRSLPLKEEGGRGLREVMTGGGGASSSLESASISEAAASLSGDRGLLPIEAILFAPVSVVMLSTGKRGKRLTARCRSASEGRRSRNRFGRHKCDPLPSCAGVLRPSERSSHSVPELLPAPLVQQRCGRGGRVTKPFIVNLSLTCFVCPSELLLFLHCR